MGHLALICRRVHFTILAIPAKFVGGDVDAPRRREAQRREIGHRDVPGSRLGFTSAENLQCRAIVSGVDVEVVICGAGGADTRPCLV